MSIYGMMRTSISGMSAQANRLSAVADNIANADTTGYKRSSIEFTTLVAPGAAGTPKTTTNYASGIVMPHLRQSVTNQGAFQFTTSVTDLAIEGNGFFIVRDEGGTPLLTRSGSFIPDGNGDLFNGAGHYLQGYPIVNGATPGVVNGYAGLVNVNVAANDLVAVPTTEGVYAANLPSNDAVAGGTPPSGNLATAEYSEKSSLMVYDYLGNQQILDIYMTKTGVNTWDIAVFDQAQAAAPGAPFPYGSGPLASGTLSFSPTDGKLTGASPTSLAIAVPGGAPMTLDISAMTQFGIPFEVAQAGANGSQPASIERVEIRSDGVLFAGYSDGTFRELYRIPLATVISPDQLTSNTGTAFSESTESGDVLIGFPNEGSAGKILSSTLEQSNVDIAEELTNMIQAQRGYSANSKVFQTGSEVVDIAINLKR